MFSNFHVVGLSYSLRPRWSSCEQNIEVTKLHSSTKQKMGHRGASSHTSHSSRVTIVRLSTISTQNCEQLITIARQ